MIMQAVIYHNPRCSKSRQTLELLQARGISPKVIEYLQTPPSEKEIGAILEMLGMEPRGLMRKQEAPYKEQNLGSEEKTRAQLVRALHDWPILIERPIVVCKGRAAIGRPPENVLAIL